MRYYDNLNAERINLIDMIMELRIVDVEEDEEHFESKNVKTM